MSVLLLLHTLSRTRSRDGLRRGVGSLLQRRQKLLAICIYNTRWWSSPICFSARRLPRFWYISLTVYVYCTYVSICIINLLYRAHYLTRQSRQNNILIQYNIYIYVCIISQVGNWSFWEMPGQCSRYVCQVRTYYQYFHMEHIYIRAPSLYIYIYYIEK